jgi:hypothetical protein
LSGSEDVHPTAGAEGVVDAALDPDPDQVEGFRGRIQEFEELELIGGPQRSSRRLGRMEVDLGEQQVWDPIELGG